jgi:hypothetical protein
LEKLCPAVKRENAIRWLLTSGKKDYARIVIKRKIVSFKPSP